jgi:hypothetical protein
MRLKNRRRVRWIPRTIGGALLLGAFVAESTLLLPRERELASQESKALEGRIEHLYALTTQASVLAAEDRHPELQRILEGAARDVMFAIYKTFQAAGAPDSVITDRRRLLESAAGTVRDIPGYFHFLALAAPVMTESYTALGERHEVLQSETRFWRQIQRWAYLAGTLLLLFATNREERGSGQSSRE